MEVEGFILHLGFWGHEQDIDISWQVKMKVYRGSLYEEQAL